MSILGILPNSSAFTNSAYSVYGASRVSSVKSEQDSSAAKNSQTKATPVDDLEDEAIISNTAVTLAQRDRITAQVEQQVKYQKHPKDEGQNTQIAQDEATQTKEKLSAEQQKQVEKLKSIDAEVKAHEKAHVAASAGISSSAPTYTYQKGPDGQNYAVAGEVQVRFVTSGDPEKTIADAKTMAASALAPSAPSGQDMSVARNADQIVAKAKKQETQQQDEAEINKKAEEAEEA